MALMGGGGNLPLCKRIGITSNPYIGRALAMSRRLEHSEMWRACGFARIQNALSVSARTVLGSVIFAGAAHAAVCAGCIGISGSQTTTSGLNMVSVTVDVASGECTGTSPDCIAEACEAAVTRAWDLPIGTSMNFCVLRPPGSPLCVFPPPVVGAPGSGSETSFDLIRCGGSKTFTLSTSSLSAQATGSCSSCL